jgi:hypothetical protein
MSSFGGCRSESHLMEFCLSCILFTAVSSRVSSGMLSRTYASTSSAASAPSRCVSACRCCSSVSGASASRRKSA